MKDLLIKQAPILASLPAEELAALEAASQKRQFAAGALLFKEGERGDSFFVILSGRAETVKALGTEDERVLGASEAGDFVGEMSLLQADRKRTASVRAVTALEAQDVPLDTFAALLKRYPQVDYELVRTLSRRLDESNNAAMRDLHQKNRALAVSLGKLRSSRLMIMLLSIALLLAVSAIAASLAYFLLSARTALDTPSDLVLMMADTGRQFIIPGDVAARANPLPSNADTLAAGRRAFTARCVLCHGGDGKGQTPIGMHIYPRASDLTSARAQARSDGTLFWITENGSPHTGMPGWKGTLKDNEIWQVIAYLRVLPKGESEITKLLPTPTAVPQPTAAPVAQPTVAPTAIPAPSVVTVTIDNYEFIPATITVPVGTRVVWLNKDIEDHTITSEDKPLLLDSPLIIQGKTFSFVFTQRGTFKYMCTPHDEMHGVVVVQ
ncbi:MAG: cyclic nucleotide-binding domain-containing protein [Chloroflexi bacterium]|nr:cyclic nucleotide-binding domain-containing protein [Chloroflexota bacterium]